MMMSLLNTLAVALTAMVFVAGAVAVAVLGRGTGRWLAAIGLALAALHTLVNVVVMPLLGATRDGDFWGRYVAYRLVSLLLSFLAWGLVAAGVITMSRWRRAPRPPGAAPVDPWRHPSEGATAADAWNP